jgi:hypothetical protein
MYPAMDSADVIFSTDSTIFLLQTQNNKQAHEVCEGQNELIMSLMTVLKIF